MKKLLQVLLLCTFCYTASAQFDIGLQNPFYVAANEVISVTNSEELYIGDDIENAGILNLGTGTLIAAGNYSNTGTINLSSATLQFEGNANQTVNFGSNDTAKKLALNKSANTATINTGNLSITDFVQATQGTLNAAGKITLKSNASKSAIVEPSTGGAIDNLVIERYIPARRAYRLVSSPVTTSTSIRANWQENGNDTAGWGTDITGTGGATNGFDATATNNASLFSFNNSSPAWVTASSTNVNLAAGDAYRLMVRGDRTVDLTLNAPAATNTTLRTTGSLYIGSKTISNLNAAANGYSLVGNPYQCPVNMKSVLDNASNVNNSYYYVWDPKVATRGAYVSVLLSNGTNNISGSMANQYLQPSQACFVKTTAAGSASIQFQESNKYTTATNENVFRPATDAQESIRLTLYDSTTQALQAPALDGLLVLFDANETNEVDGNDAGKFTNLDETLASVNSTKSLSIESRNLPQSTDVIPLKITQYRVSNYNLVLEGTNNTSLACYLYDALLQSYTQIPTNGNSTYSFGVDATNAASTATDRFQLVFDNPNLSTAEPTKTLFSLYPNPANNQFTVALPVYLQETSLSVYTNIGQLIYNEALTEAGIHTIPIPANCSPGIYWVKVSQNGISTTQKLLIN
ncbi:MAG: T9SS type A sorting domain-containing protein [Flavobacterium psychrophilum]